MPLVQNTAYVGGGMDFPNQQIHAKCMCGWGGSWRVLCRVPELQVKAYISLAGNRPWRGNNATPDENLFPLCP